jgi:GT2 family glycosyltransferase
VSTPDGPVRVLLVTHDSAELLPGFAEHLPAALAGVDHEIVVVDSASSDHSAAAASRLLPSATVVELGRNAGYAAGVNAGTGVRPLCGPLLICNPDLRLGPAAVPTMLRVLDDPQVGIVAPRLVDAAGRPEWSLRRDPSVTRVLGEAVLGGERAGRHARWGEMITDPEVYRRPTDVEWASGACLLVRRECLEQVGPWDETYLLYSEETDFCLRARDLGWRIRYEPAASAVHLGGDAQHSPQLFALLTVNRVRCYRRRHDPAATAAFWAALTLGTAVRAAAGRRPARAALTALLRPSVRRRVRSLP